MSESELCRQVTATFLQNCVLPWLNAEDADAGHIALALARGAIVAAAVEGNSPELRQRLREIFEGEVSVEPFRLAVIRGGKT